MAVQDPDKEVRKKEYTPLEAIKEAGKFLAFMSITAATLFLAEVIVKVLLHGLEYLHGEPYPAVVKHLIDGIIIALFLLFVVLYALLHMREFWLNLKRGWKNSEEAKVSDQVPGPDSN